MIVPYGAKLHSALYPSRETLLADELGMTVMIAREKWTIAKMRCVGDVFSFILFSF